MSAPSCWTREASRGPTGRSSAICRAYYTNAFPADVACESIAMVRGFPEHTGRESGSRPNGLLVLHPPEDEATVREVLPRLNGQGIPTDLLTPEEITTEWPAFDLSGIGLGAHELDAGASFDIASYFFSAAAIDANLSTGSVTGEGTDTLTGIEVLEGSRFDDTLTGDEGGNSFMPGDGDDIIDEGGGLTDEVSYFYSANAVTVDLGAGTATGEGTDSITGIESIYGSPFDDTIVGDANPNELWGGAGDNSLDGGLGTDSLDGGDGTDTCLNGEDNTNCEA